MNETTVYYKRVQSVLYIYIGTYKSSAPLRRKNTMRTTITNRTPTTTMANKPPPTPAPITAVC